MTELYSKENLDTENLNAKNCQIQDLANTAFPFTYTDFKKFYKSQDDTDILDRILSTIYSNPLIELHKGSFADIIICLSLRSDVKEILKIFPDEIWKCLDSKHFNFPVLESKGSYPAAVIDNQSLVNNIQNISTCSSSLALALLYTVLKNISTCFENENPTLAKLIDTIDTSKASLNIVTYNVWGLPPLFKGSAPKRFELIGKELQKQNLDIICLQEMWDKQTAKIIDTLSYPFCANGGRYPGLRNASGLVTLSRYPIIEEAFYPFKDSSLIERIVKKGVLRTCIATPYGEVEVLNVHMCSDSETSVAKANAIRMKQVREIISIIESLSNDRPVIVLGDFNVSDGDQDSELLLQNLQHDLFLRSHVDAPLLEQKSTFDYDKNSWASKYKKIGVGFRSESSRLDRIHLNGGFSTAFCVETEVCFTKPLLNKEHHLSDHFGLKARLTFFDWLFSR